MSTLASKELDVFPNPKPSRDYTIRIESPEFTCLCPKTGQPDFATLELEYVPDDLCVELKSWKLYLWSYRDEGAFHEAVTNDILDDLVAAIQPRYARLTAEFQSSGKASRIRASNSLTTASRSASESLVQTRPARVRSLNS